MSVESSNNRRIAKNTILLYGRQLFVMIVGLYISRVVLSALGVEDYGVYNVVGGLVSIFSVVSSSMTNSISRFITFELGKNGEMKLDAIFSTSVNIQIVFSLIIIILCETIGLWFLNSHMNIPEGRLYAANYVFQASLIIFVINLISVPYCALIIAHEDMNAFAVVSIIDTFLKLIVALLISNSQFDKLIYYVILLAIEALLIRVIYSLYCRHKYIDCSYHLAVDKKLLSEMFRFAGWNFLGVGAYTLNTQGVNLLMNSYYGVVVNAARGIVTQVNNAIIQFVSSFTTAVNPQITKSFASGNLNYMYSLVFRSSKFSVYLYVFLAIPLAIEAPMIFKIWLGNIPDYVVPFFRLNLLSILIDNVLCNSLMTAVYATGDIKKYQLIVTLLGSLVFPVTWFLYYLGLAPQCTYVVYSVVYCIVLFVRLLLLREKMSFSPRLFFQDVLKPVFFVILIGIIASLSVTLVFNVSYLRIVLSFLVSTIALLISIIFLGLSKEEYLYLKERVLKLIRF